MLGVEGKGLRVVERVIVGLVGQHSGQVVLLHPGGWL